MIRILIAGLLIAFGAVTSARAQFVPSFVTKEAPNPVSPQKSTPAEGTETKEASKPVPSQKSAPAEGIESKNAQRAAATIGPGDVLDISVFQVPELSKTLDVSGTGTINFPLLGEIRAAGKTPGELESELTSKLAADYLQHPVVTVLVKENNSQQVTISGAIDKPGIYPIKGPTSLMEIVAVAGGFKDQSDWTVLILRQKGVGRMAARYDVAEIEAGRAQDPLLQANDVLVAGTSAIKQTFNTILQATPLGGAVHSAAGVR
jgi:polysaccharide export outer membrane protein